MNRKHIFTVICLLGILISGCNNMPAPQTKLTPPERSLPCDVNCENAVTDTTNMLTLDLVNQLLMMLKNYPGIKPQIPVAAPEQWIAEFQIPAFTPEFDIWILSPLGNPTLKVMATVSRTEEPLIIQAIPIAMVAGKEKKNVIESEIWTAQIDEEYNIVVNKKYEKIFSFVDNEVPKENISASQQDSYTINFYGTVVYTPPVTYNADYMAIIQFADTLRTGAMTGEEWIWNSVYIKDAAESNDILFGLIYTDFSRVSICNYYGETLDVVDLSSFIDRHSTGYIFLKKGQKPGYAPNGTVKEIFTQASEYFGATFHFLPDEDTCGGDEEPNETENN